MGRPLPRSRRNVLTIVMLWRWFDAGGMGTAPEIAAQLGVSTRTAERWLLEIEGEVPLVPIRACYVPGRIRAGSRTIVWMSLATATARGIGGRGAA